MDNVTEIVTEVETVEVTEAEVVVEEINTYSLLETFEPESITETEQVVEVVTDSIIESVAESDLVVEVITDEGRQGPPGPPGIVEEDIVYAKRLDMVSSDVFYRGEAQVGSSEDAPVWRIRRITITNIGGLVDVSEEWAGGQASFSNVWADRALLAYY